MSAPIAMGDRFTFLGHDSHEGSTSWLCGAAAPFVCHEVSSVRDDTVYFYPVFACCDQRHDHGVSGAKTPPLRRTLDEILTGACEYGSGAPAVTA